MTTFEKLALSPETNRALKEMGFTVPTKIQAESIPILMQGVDLISQAMTGSGKTAAFGIYITESIDKNLRKPQALILTPTRELAVQVTQELKNIGKHHHLSVVTVYGGASINVQADQLKRGAHIVVGTPGRIMDMLERRALHLDGVRIAVLDEADRMLDMGFIDDVKRILEHTPDHRQTLLFSATMPDEIRALANRYMKNPESLTVSTDAVPIDKIKQSYIMVEGRKKFPMLTGILKSENPELALVFVRTKYEASKIAHKLNQEGFKANSLHGNLSQNQRDKAMHAFKHGHSSVMVATDIAARGLDISGITHVINYDLPIDGNTYSHRVGRTARAGASGKAYSFVTPEQRMELRDITRTTGIVIEQERREGDVSEEDLAKFSSIGGIGEGRFGRGYGGQRGGYGRGGYGRSGYGGRDQVRYRDHTKGIGSGSGEGRPSHRGRSSYGGRPSHRGGERPRREGSSYGRGQPSYRSGQSSSRGERPSHRTGGPSHRGAQPSRGKEHSHKRTGKPAEGTWPQVERRKFDRSRKKENE